MADIITRYQTQNIKELVDEDKILGRTFSVKRNLKQPLVSRLETIELENLNESQVHKIQNSKVTRTTTTTATTTTTTRIGRQQ